MSYEMMETLVVEKIAGLRESEAIFARSLRAAQNGSAVDLNAVHQRIQAQLHEIEQLLASMESTPAIPAFVAADASQPMHSSVWI